MYTGATVKTKVKQFVAFTWEIIDNIHLQFGLGFYWVPVVALARMVPIYSVCLFSTFTQCKMPDSIIFANTVCLGGVVGVARNETSMGQMPVL